MNPMMLKCNVKMFAACVHLFQLMVRRDMKIDVKCSQFLLRMDRAMFSLESDH